MKKGYENRLRNISYLEARELVHNKIGNYTTKRSRGMMWTQRTKDVFFYDTTKKLVAIYSFTIKDFWWTRNS